MFMLREIRQSRNMTMAELGEKIGVTESAIGLYESGKRKPNYELLLQMAEVLNCSVDSILGNNVLITPDEDMLLYLFRQLNRAGKKELLNIAANFSESAVLAEKNNPGEEGLPAKVKDKNVSSI